MLVHKFEVYCVDFEEYGAESYAIDMKDGVDFAMVTSSETIEVDIDEDDFDDSPFNSCSKIAEAFQTHSKT